MPKAFDAASTLVDTATKWRCSSASGTPPAIDQSRAVCAFIIVSAVVKVFDATTNSVVAGSSDGERVDHRLRVDVGDELHGQARGGGYACSSAEATKRGPRSEPPMPMCTMSVIVRPECPVHDPSWIRATKSSM